MSDVYLDSSAIGYQNRVRRLMLVVFLVFAGLLLRLAHLQLIEGEDLREASARNFIRTEVLPADRGTIYDRNGVALAVNRPAFDLYVTPSKVEAVDALVAGLGEVLSLDELDGIRLRERIEQPRGLWRHRPVRVARDIDRTLVSKIEALRSRISGLTIKVEYQREYPHGEVGAHVLGYLGKPRPDELRKYAERGYTADTMMGRFGLERRFEQVLAGRRGKERYVVNARGARQDKAPWAKDALEGLTRRTPPERGNDLWLTVDVEVQKILVEALEPHESGAAVVMRPDSGELLGIVSKPAFDPNQWSGRLSREAYEKFRENPYNPMLDKAVHAYFPGSIYKVVTGLAALEEGILDANEPIDSPGKYVYGGNTFRCHKRSGHGKVDLFEAMAASADVYFYRLGEEMGLDVMAKYARLFNLGEKPGLEINGEARGTVPTRAHHEKIGNFQHGLALSTAIGQGDVRTSPLQMAMTYAAFANGGTVWAPRVVASIRTADGRVVKAFDEEKVRELPVDPSNVSIIHRSLERVVNDEKRGTGHLAGLPYGTVAGKTGTAQVRKIVRGLGRQNVKRFRDRDHAWFAAYAPWESPRIVVVVFLEHGGSGGKDAAPVARRIIEAYHQRIEPIFQTTASSEQPRRRRRRR